MAKALTVPAIEKIKADPSKRLEIPDGRMAGLYLRVTPAGVKSWSYRYRVHGKLQRLTLGNYPGVGLADAREKARAASLEVQRGGDPAAARQHERETADIRLFDTVVRDYITGHCRPRNRTWMGTARLIGLGVGAKQDDVSKAEAIPGSALAKWGHKPIGSITRAEVVAYVDGIVAGGAPTHGNRTLAALKHLFGWAVDKSRLDAHPFVNTKPPAPEQSRDRVLNDDEIRALWGACEGAGWPFGPLVQMLLLSGQRRDEVGGLRWKEIDGNLWTLPASRSKNGKPHVVPLPPAAVAILEMLPRVKGEGGFVFTTNGKTPVSGFSRAKAIIDRRMLEALRKQAAEAGGDPAQVTLPPWRFHDLRRTAATGMARAGADIATIERVLNHTSGTFAGVVGTYQRFDFADEKARALIAWGNLVDEIVSGKPAGNIVALPVGKGMAS